MAKDNEAQFTISGKISLAIVGTVITFLLTTGKMMSDYYAMEKRLNSLETTVEKTCLSINHIDILNTRIETNLTHIKESLQEHTRTEAKGSK
jgi:t-SNARE complex subunit (syntaxin)